MRTTLATAAILLIAGAPAFGAGSTITRLDHNYIAGATAASDFIIDPVDGLQRIEAHAAISGAGALSRSGLDRLLVDEARPAPPNDNFGFVRATVTHDVGMATMPLDGTRLEIVGATMTAGGVSTFPLAVSTNAWGEVLFEISAGASLAITGSFGTGVDYGYWDSRSAAWSLERLDAPATLGGVSESRADYGLMLSLDESFQLDAGLYRFAYAYSMTDPGNFPAHGDGAYAITLELGAAIPAPGSMALFGLACAVALPRRR
jgi:hypothetical protein